MLFRLIIIPAFNLPMLALAFSPILMNYVRINIKRRPKQIRDRDIQINRIDQLKNIKRIK